MDVVNVEKVLMENKSWEKVNRWNWKWEKYVLFFEFLEFLFCWICGKRVFGIYFGVYSCEVCKVKFCLFECWLFFCRLNIKLYVSKVENINMYFSMWIFFCWINILIWIKKFILYRFFYVFEFFWSKYSVCWLL